MERSGCIGKSLGIKELGDSSPRLGSSLVLFCSRNTTPEAEPYGVTLSTQSSHRLWRVDEFLRRLGQVIFKSFRRIRRQEAKASNSQPPGERSWHLRIRLLDSCRPSHPFSLRQLLH